MPKKTEINQAKANADALDGLQEKLDGVTKQAETLSQRHQQVVGDLSVLQQLYGESQVNVSKYQSVIQQLGQQNEQLKAALKAARDKIAAPTPTEGETESQPSESSETK